MNKSMGELEKCLHKRSCLWHRLCLYQKKMHGTTERKLERLGQVLDRSQAWNARPDSTHGNNGKAAASCKVPNHYLVKWGVWKTRDPSKSHMSFLKLIWTWVIWHIECNHRRGIHSNISRYWDICSLKYLKKLKGSWAHWRLTWSMKYWRSEW